MTFSWNVGCDLHSVRESNSGDLSNGRVRLLWSLGSNLRAYASLEWRIVEDRSVLDMVKASSQGDRLALALCLISILLD